MFRVRDEVSYSSCGFAGSPAGTPSADVARSSSRYLGLTRRNGQRTERLSSTLAAIGLALAGRAGSRLAAIVGAPVSRSTVLRLVDALPEPEVPAPRASARPPSGVSPSTGNVLRVLVPETPEPAEAEADLAEESSGSPWPTGHRFADRTRTVHATNHALVEAGHSRRAIQRQLGMTSRTVKRYADAVRPEDLMERSS